MRPLLLLPLALVAASPGGDWRLRLPIAVAPGARLQRVVLPARAMLALRRSDGGDLRVLDANGRAQPIARAEPPLAPGRRLALTPLPILGAADALKVTGVTLKVDDGQARVVRVDGTPAGAGGRTLGVLLDTRAVDAPAQALVLAMDAPANQPVTVTLESSGDLQHWTAEGERVLFRTGAADPLTIALPGTALRGRTLRVTWRAQGRLLAPVTVRAATLALRPASEAGRLSVDALLPPLIDRHHADFILPLAVAPAALSVTPAAGDTPTPIEVFGRRDREQPWTIAGRGIAAPDGEIELSGAFREWRIAAAAVGEGFGAPPRVRLRFAPLAVAFVAAGAAPYTLAVGREDAGAGFLPPASLERMTGEAVDASAPAGIAAPPPAPLALPPIPTGPSTTAWLLWGVLLIGVAALGAMAWSLSRPSRVESVPTEPTG